MSLSKNVPGLYRQEVVLRPDPRLLTGIAGFVGFADLSGEEAATPVVALHRRDEFAARIKGAQGGYLADAVEGFFQNGGLRCHVACARFNPTDSDAQRAGRLIKGLESLAALTDIDLVAIPDAMMIYWPDDQKKIDVISQLQIALLQHCGVNPGRLAILDALPATAEVTLNQRRRITSGIKEPVNGSLYYPWIKTYEGRLVPPCGHVAGIYARSDRRAGVWKAPANEEVVGALDLGVLVKKTENKQEMLAGDAVNPDQEALNPEGVNCLRAFPGRGIRVWGARTLSGDPAWRYINVRRLFLTLQRWVDSNMNWVSFEPNTPVLWIRITREIASYLVKMWGDGGLAGQAAKEAFYVKCDAETNPQQSREAGQVITEVGLAPTLPSEFIMVRIVHHTAVEPR